jgi:hypothetical protein
MAVLVKNCSKMVYIKEVTEKGSKNPYIIGPPKGCCGNDLPD